MSELIQKEYQALYNNLTEKIYDLKKTIANLENCSIKLDCLHAHGVDNWDGYGEAIKQYRKLINEKYYIRR